MVKAKQKRNYHPKDISIVKRSFYCETCGKRTEHLNWEVFNKEYYQCTICTTKQTFVTR